MSDLDSAEKKLHETIAKLSYEVDRLSARINEISILEKQHLDPHKKLSLKHN